MDQAELDDFLARLILLDGNAEGFLNARISSYSPLTIEIAFANNETADSYVTQKQLNGASRISVNPPNGATVVWLK